MYADKLVIVAEAQVVATHERIFTRDHNGPGKTCYDWRHYLAVVQRKPGALRNGAPFLSLPKSFKQLQRRLLKRLGGDREMADILALVLHHDEQIVEQAVSLALSSGEVSKEHVINCLNRLLEVPLPAPLNPPKALNLAEEPQPNTQRYDHLREKHHAS